MYGATTAAKGKGRNKGLDLKGCAGDWAAAAGEEGDVCCRRLMAIAPTRHTSVPNILACVYLQPLSNFSSLNDTLFFRGEHYTHPP